MSRIRFLVGVGFVVLSVPASRQGGRASLVSDRLIHFGTYTSEKSKGVYVSRLDIASGALSAPELSGATANPSYLAVHPTFNSLYAANEVGTFSGKETGSVSAATSLVRASNDCFALR